MYIIRQETNYSVAQIGRVLGNRDAALVTTACKSIAKEIENNRFLKRKLHEIQRMLHQKQNTKIPR